MCWENNFSFWIHFGFSFRWIFISYSMRWRCYSLLDVPFKCCRVQYMLSFYFLYFSDLFTSNWFPLENSILIVCYVNIIFVILLFYTRPFRKLLILLRFYLQKLIWRPPRPPTLRSAYLLSYWTVRFIGLQ